MAKLNKKKVGVIAGGVAALAVIGVVATTLLVNGQSAPVTAAVFPVSFMVDSFRQGV